MAKTYMQQQRNLSLGIAFASILSYAKPALAEDSVRDKVRYTFVMEAGARWFDLTKSALEEYVEDNDVQPMRISDFPSYARQGFESTFPESVLSSVEIYNGIPLTSLTETIGRINNITDIIGGVPPAGQTFGTRIYLQNFDIRQLEDRKTLVHEMVHVSQYMELGYEGFRTRYLDAIARGIPYEEIPLEVEAQNFAAEWPRLSIIKHTNEVSNIKSEDLYNIFNVKQWSPKFYKDIAEQTPCTLTYSARDPLNNQVEVYTLPNLKICLYENIAGTDYNTMLVDFVELQNGKRIPLKAIDNIHPQGNRVYNIGRKESIVENLTLSDFLFASVNYKSSSIFLLWFGQKKSEGYFGFFTGSSHYKRKYLWDHTTGRLFPVDNLIGSLQIECNN